MFYSHEILTDRKHGVATIWLVATLGSKSSLKKVTRKAIMEVNVPEACGTITDPSAPMALRLQGNLLFGVSRVFSQQCAYVLTDMQSLKDKMRGISILLKELETDPEVAATRPEQLNLQADPGFNIDLDLGFDLSSFGTTFSSSEPSSLLSPRTLASTQTSFIEDEQMLELRPPLEASSHDAGEGFGFDDIELASGAVGEQLTSKPASELAVAQQPSVVEEAAFDFDEEGNVIFRDEQDQPPAVEQSASDGLIVRGLDTFELNLDADHTEARDVQTPLQAVDDDHQIYFGGDDEPQFDQGPPPQTPTARSSPLAQQAQRSIEGDGDAEDSREETNAVSGAAQQRTVKTKTIPVDNPAELQNRVLNEWNDNYLGFMREAHIENASKISIAQAKRNAAYWVLDQGIGGVDSHFRSDSQEHPLAVFSGQALFDALIGPQAQPPSRKRARSATGNDGDDEAASRRVRSSPHGKEGVGIEDDGLQIMADDDQGLTLGEDDFEPEVGRHEQPPMSEHQDSFPWNAYASSKQGSRHGSARPVMSMMRATSSAGGRAGFDLPASSMGSKRVSRLIAESPLEQRRRLLRHSSILSGSRRAQDDTGLGSADDNFGLDLDISDTALDRELAGNLPNIDDFELYGPGAAVSTQQAADSHWLAATLEQEAFNFLDFLQTTIEGKQANLDDDDDNKGNVTVTFSELLPPENNSEVVAAQGLLHVLSLATKGLIIVRQEEDFGDIDMGVVPGLATAEDAEVVED